VQRVTDILSFAKTEASDFSLGPNFHLSADNLVLDGIRIRHWFKTKVFDHVSGQTSHLTSKRGNILFFSATLLIDWPFIIRCQAKRLAGKSVYKMIYSYRVGRKAITQCN